MLGSGHQAFTSEPGTDISYGIADAEQLAILGKAVDDHCRKHGIVSDSDRELIATRVMCLFRQNMIDPAQISAELERAG